LKKITYKIVFRHAEESCDCENLTKFFYFILNSGPKCSQYFQSAPSTCKLGSLWTLYQIGTESVPIWCRNLLVILTTS